MKKRKRILEHLTNQELSSRTVKDIANEYYIHEMTVYVELKRRGLNQLQKEEQVFNVTIQDLKTIPLAHIAKRERTTQALLYRYIHNTYGIKRKEVFKLYKVHNDELRRIDVLSDEELSKPNSYLVKTYRTTSTKIKEERLKRGLNFKNFRFRLIHVSDDDLFNLSLEELRTKHCVTYDTISRERQKRRMEKDPNFKKRPRNLLKNVSDEELFGKKIKVIAAEYNVSNNTVCNERKKRRDNGTV